MTNRVDELESKVAKLQATVDGLTEELVETKERVRLLEESVDVDLTTGTRTTGYEPGSESETEADTQADAEPEPETAPGGGPDPLTESQAQTASRTQTSETGSNDADFIDAGTDDAVPSEAVGDGATADGDGTKTDGDDSDDETVTTDDDIIVA